MPSGPAAGGPVQRGPVPSSVLTAQKLMFIRAGLGLIGLIVALATKGSLKTQIRKNNPDFDAAKLDTAVNVAITFAVVVGLVFLVLYILLALQVGKGKNWARIVTFVLATIGVLGALAGLAQNGTALSKVLALIGGVLDLAVIILLARGESSRFFSPKATPIQ